MAAGNGTPTVELTREERLAELIVDRGSLTPPIDVREVAAEHADVEFDVIPGGCDGLVVGLQGHRKTPLIVVNSSDHPVRQRFTLAHELGHVLLPWHLGDNLACDTNAQAHPEWWETLSSDEPEANRFAAELLVPGGWIDALIGARGDDRVELLVKDVLHAEVSTWVASFRLAERLPAGHVFAVVNSSGRVAISGQTVGTSIDPPERDAPLDGERLDRMATAREEISWGSQTIIWWTFRGRSSDVLEVPEGTAKLALKELAERYGGAAATKLVQSCNGITGLAFDGAKRSGEASAGQLYALFRGRFAKSRGNLPAGFTEDPLFDAWLRLRASEMASRG